MTHNELSFLRSLHQKKFRQEHRCFLVEGRKLILEVLKSDLVVRVICATNAWKEHHPDFAHPTQAIKQKECEQVSNMSTPPGIFAVVEYKEEEFLPEAAAGNILLLDKIKDTGNLGTIIRTADWFGVRTIICSPDTAELYNPKTIQASTGSFMRVRVIYCDLTEFITLHAQRYTFYGTFMMGQPLHKTYFEGQTAIVLGSESHGISPPIARLLPNKLNIRRAKTFLPTAAESLNVSTAAALVCYQMQINQSV